MGVYLYDVLHSLNSDRRNLFALRGDLHLSQFDQARFVIAPKFGQLVIHFLHPTHESAQRYHNVQFDHNKTLSHELVYARFAWALMQIVKSSELDPNEFKLLQASDIEDGMGRGGGDSGGGGGDEDRDGDRDGDGSGGGEGGGRGSRKRKRKHTDDENYNDDDGHYGDTSANFGLSSNLRSSNRVTFDACSQEGETRAISHLPELYANGIEPDSSQLLLDRETQEFEEDMRKAARPLPFFGKCFTCSICKSVLMVS